MSKEKKKIEYIEDLDEIGPSTAKKLGELGFNTLESLATATVKELLSAGISEKQASKIISKVRDSITVEFTSANELMRIFKRNDIAISFEDALLVPKQASSLRLPRSGADDFTGT